MIETDRLQLIRLTYEDSQFVIDLLNEPNFVRYIGDRGVRTIGDAKAYLEDGPIGSYEKHGFGLFLVRLKNDTTPLGICGLVKREEFAHPDLGFAFLERFWSNGYAYESSRAVLRFSRQTLSLHTIIAIADRDNTRSLVLLEKLGFEFEKMVLMPGETEEICQYKINIGEDS